jgi:hypothetical protein
MKFKLVIAVLASTVVLSSVSASERIHRHSHYRDAYNSMNMMQAPAPSYRSSYGAGYSYGEGYPYGSSYGYSAPGGSNLSGTGSSQFGGGAADGAGGGGGGGP